MAALTTQRTNRIILIVAGLLTLVLGTTIVAGAAANATPIAFPDDRLDQTVGRPVVVPVVANDVDDDGNLNASSVRIIDPANLASRLTRIVVANEGVWQVSTSTGAVTFTPCTAAGVPDASCTTLFTGNPFPIEYTVKDTSGAESNPAIITITFNSSSNGSPLVIDDQASTERNQAVTIAVLDNDSDPGGALVASTLTVVVAPSAGTTKISSGKIIYTPKTDYTGTDQFAYRVCDNGSPQLCATAIVTVTVLQPAVNNPPVARNDTVTTPQGQAVTIPVLANDSDSDGTLNPASLTIATAAGHGTAVANANGTVLYTPNALYSGADQFTYRVCDQGSPPACAMATVFVTVQAPANQAPLVRADQAATVRDQAVTIPVLSNDQDPDGTLNAASVTVTTQPAHGATVVNSNGTVKYTPVAGYTGTDTFTYKVCDSATPALCGSAQVTVTVNAPTNQTPKAVNDNAVTLKNTAVAVTVLANDSDPDGTLNTGSVTVTSQPNHGNTAVNGSGVVTYTPDTGYTGSDNFTYQVCDNGSPALCDTAVVSVTVNAPANQAPSAVNDSAVTQRNQAVAIAVLGNDRDSDGALDVASLTVTVAP
ncbi:MAG: tandem-95 repeat protein, partial [Caldilineaceae bacterium]|nr:tandem-95 repeat protein [Caldilineaceae bacterium]